MNKLIVDGKVAVLLSPEHGAGWSTWNTVSCPDNNLLYDPVIVDIVLKRDSGEITRSEYANKVEARCKELYGDTVYTGGAHSLEVVWVPVGAYFKINEYDGYETIEYKDGDQWMIA